MKKRTIFLTIAFRVAAFTLLWFILTDVALYSWYLGIPVVILSVLASLLLMPPISLSPLAVLRFMPFFLWHSLRGGVDVAKKALQPKMSINPELIEYPWKLATPAPQILMVSIVSLLPGSLSVEFNDKYLQIHVLENTDKIIAELSILEQKISQIFRIESHLQN